MLLNIFGFVGDHPNERVELYDGHEQVDDEELIFKKSLQCGHEFCMTEDKKEMNQGQAHD